MNGVKRYLLSVAVLVAALLTTMPLVAQPAADAVAATESYTFNHGPYLQALSYDGVTICFSTSHRGFSGVELRVKGSDEAQLYRTSKDGLFEADNTFNAIRIDGLSAATEYEYRLTSKRMLSFEPYKVVFGEQITSPWYSFRTFDPAADEVTFVVANDIHDDAYAGGGYGILQWRYYEPLLA